MKAETRAWIPEPKCCFCGGEFEKRAVLELKKAWICKNPPCAERQIAAGMYVNKKLVYLPLPRQTELHEAILSGQYEKILYGGALGGGKSEALRWESYHLCQTHKKFAVLILRRTIEELKKHHIMKAIGEADTVNARWLAQEKRLEFDNDSYVQMGHCQHPSDVKIWLGLAYDLIVFDELVTFEEDMFVRISSRAGREDNDDGWEGMILAGTNPGSGPWIQDLFMTKTRDPIEYPDYNPDAYLYLPAILDDNPFVRKTYVKFLADLPKEVREAYRWGRWDRFPMQFFPGFDRALHVVRDAA